MKCSVEGCDNEVRNKKTGLCSKHYMRLQRHGTTDLMSEEQRDSRREEKVMGATNAQVEELRTFKNQLTAELSVCKTALVRACKLVCKDCKTKDCKKCKKSRIALMKQAQKELEEGM